MGTSHYWQSAARVPSLPSVPGIVKLLLFLLSDVTLLHYEVSLHLRTGCLMTISSPHQLRIF